MPLADLRRELRLRAGPVPASLPDALVERADFAASRDGFVLTVAPSLRFHYRRGKGVRYQAGDGVDRAAVRVWPDVDTFFVAGRRNHPVEPMPLRSLARLAA